MIRSDRCLPLEGLWKGAWRRPSVTLFAPLLALVLPSEEGLHCVWRGEVDVEGEESIPLATRALLRGAKNADALEGVTLPLIVSKEREPECGVREGEGAAFLLPEPGFEGEIKCRVLRDTERQDADEGVTGGGGEDGGVE